MVLRKMFGLFEDCHKGVNCACGGGERRLGCVNGFCLVLAS